MTYLLDTNFTELNALFKQHEPAVNDLQLNLIKQLPEFQKELDLDFVHSERIRHYLEDKGTLFRFLRRAGFNFDIAWNALIANIRWRIENDVDALSLQDIHPQFIENGLFFFHKTDQLNRPYAILNLREYKRQDGNPSLDDVKRCIVYNAEIARKTLWNAMKQSKDCPILQYVILLDLKGASVTNLDIELGPFVMDLARHHYPSSIAAIFVLNYGWMYSGMWQIVKRILPKESLGRIFFPTQEELFDYFDKDNVLIEHGGTDEYTYKMETCRTLQKYGNPLPLLRMPAPLSRASSFDDLHDVFFSARSTPFVTPFHSRPGTPFGGRTSNSFGSRPASPISEHVSIPSWLAMTPSASGTRSSQQFLPSISSYDINRKNYVSETTILSPQPIKPTLSRQGSSMYSPQLRFNQDIPIPHSHYEGLYKINHENQFQDEATPIDSPNFNDDIPLLPSSTLYRLLRFHQTFKLYLAKLLRRFVTRRVSGGIYWLVVVVLLRGGFVNDFWNLITRRVTMQLGWNASTTTTLTTAVLSAALNGRAGNCLLLGR